MGRFGCYCDCKVTTLFWIVQIFCEICEKKFMQTIQFIPLRLIEHNDKTLIITAYSREEGRIAFSVAGGSKKRRSLLMPLNPVECQAKSRAGKELFSMQEPRALMPIHAILASPVRSAVCMFMAEVLDRLLRQPQPDPLLFDFLIDAISRLNDPKTPIANFHLCFMLLLGRQMGIAPDPDPSARYFNLSAGGFRSTIPAGDHVLNEAESRHAAKFLRMTWENQHLFKYAREQRARILSEICTYFSLHIAPLNNLRSPAVLHALFSC